MIRIFLPSDPPSIFLPTSRSVSSLRSTSPMILISFLSELLSGLCKGAFAGAAAITVTASQLFDPLHRYGWEPYPGIILIRISLPAPKFPSVTVFEDCIPDAEASFRSRMSERDGVPCPEVAATFTALVLLEVLLSVNVGAQADNKTRKEKTIKRGETRKSNIRKHPKLFFRDTSMPLKNNQYDLVQ